MLRRPLGWGHAGGEPELGQDAWPQVGWCQEGKGHFVFMGRGTVAEGEEPERMGSVQMQLGPSGEQLIVCSKMASRS